MDNIIVTGTRAVTATKSESDLIEVPQSISVITNQEIRDRTAIDLQDIFRYSAGVAPDESIDPRGDFITARGFDAEQYLDGLKRMPDFIYGARLENYTLERAEVLRGPSSVLYGADWPVASANPFEGLEVAVTRREPGKPDTHPLLEHESVTLEEAIRAYTIDVAHVTNLADETGSLTTGKSADLIIVDQDIFSIPAHEIAKTNVLLTLFRGRAVHGEWSRL